MKNKENLLSFCLSITVVLNLSPYTKMTVTNWSYLGWRSPGESGAHTCPGFPEAEAPVRMVTIIAKMMNLPTLFLTLCPLNLLWSMYKSVIIPYSRSSLMMMRRQFSETNMWHVASWVMWDEWLSLDGRWYRALTVLKDDHGVSNEFSGSSSNLSLSLSPSRLPFELGFQSVGVLKDVQIPGKYVQMQIWEQYQCLRLIKWSAGDQNLERGWSETLVRGRLCPARGLQGPSAAQSVQPGGD